MNNSITTLLFQWQGAEQGKALAHLLWIILKDLPGHDLETTFANVPDWHCTLTSVETSSPGFVFPVMALEKIKALDFSGEEAWTLLRAIALVLLVFDQRVQRFFFGNHTLLTEDLGLRPPAHERYVGFIHPKGTHYRYAQSFMHDQHCPTLTPIQLRGLARDYVESARRIWSTGGNNDPGIPKPSLFAELDD